MAARTKLCLAWAVLWGVFGRIGHFDTKAQISTISIPKLKVYIFFEKFYQVKFEQTFRTIYQQI
jgi:hypothetical protein